MIMEKNRFDDVMFEAVASTVEGMAFTEVLTADQEMAEEGSEYIVRLNILEPHEGWFQLMMGQDLMYFITEAMLAKPREEIPEENLVDFLSELLNTIGGSFLRNLVSDNTTFTLDLPERVLAKGSSEAEPAVQWNFTAEENIFSVVVSEKLLEYLDKTT